MPKQFPTAFGLSLILIAISAISARADDEVIDRAGRKGAEAGGGDEVHRGAGLVPGDEDARLLRHSQQQTDAVARWRGAVGLSRERTLQRQHPRPRGPADYVSARRPQPRPTEATAPSPCSRISMTANASTLRTTSPCARRHVLVHRSAVGTDRTGDLPGHWVFKLDPTTGAVESVTRSSPCRMASSSRPTRVDSTSPTRAATNWHPRVPQTACRDPLLRREQGRNRQGAVRIEQGSDGMRVDVKGNLYTTTGGKVHIYSPDGASSSNRSTCRKAPPTSASAATTCRRCSSPPARRSTASVRRIRGRSRSEPNGEGPSARGETRGRYGMARRHRSRAARWRLAGVAQVWNAIEKLEVSAWSIR